LKDISTVKLANIFREMPSDQAVALSNLFALGCFVHWQGHTDAGLKACRSALNEIRAGDQKTYFNNLIGNLAGNEAAFVRELGCHKQISRLFPDAPLSEA